MPSHIFHLHHLMQSVFQRSNAHKKKKKKDDTVIFVILIKKIVAKPYCKSMTKRNLQYKIIGNIKERYNPLLSSTVQRHLLSSRKKPQAYLKDLTLFKAQQCNDIYLIKNLICWHNQPDMLKKYIIKKILRRTSKYQKLINNKNKKTFIFSLKQYFPYIYNKIYKRVCRRFLGGISLMKNSKCNHTLSWMKQLFVLQ